MLTARLRSKYSLNPNVYIPPRTRPQCTRTFGANMLLRIIAQRLCNRHHRALCRLVPLHIIIVLGRACCSLAVPCQWKELRNALGVLGVGGWSSICVKVLRSYARAQCRPL